MGQMGGETQREKLGQRVKKVTIIWFWFVRLQIAFLPFINKLNQMLQDIQYLHKRL